MGKQPETVDDSGPGVSLTVKETPSLPSMGGDCNSWHLIIARKDKY